MATVLQKWGLGVELTFKASQAIREMGAVQRRVQSVRRGFSQLRESAGHVATGLVGLTVALTPVALGYTAILAKSSALAADLESQKLTMRILLGDAVKADNLIAKLREKAAATPFAESDLIEGSKRLLGLTGQNVEKNLELLDIATTMSALSPTKSVTDSVEALLDAASGGGFERLKEYPGLRIGEASDFAAFGKTGGEAWGDAVLDAIGGKVKEITRGEDLVGELSKTFAGRFSTLKDVVGQTFTGIGEQLNAKLGPGLDKALVFAKLWKEDIAVGFGLFAEQVSSLWSSHIQPVLDGIEKGMVAMGSEGRSNASMVAFALGAIATAFVVVMAAAGGAAVVLASVGSILTGLAGLASFAVFEALAVVALSAGANLAILAAWVAVVFRALSTEGEGPLDTLKRLGDMIWSVLVGAFEAGKNAVLGFTEGFVSGFGDATPLIDKAINPLARAFTQVIDVLSDLWNTSRPTKTFFKTMGVVIGAVARWIASGMATAFSVITNAVELATQVFLPFLLILIPVMDAIMGLIAGTRTFGDVTATVFGAVVKTIAAMLNAVFLLVVGFMELILRSIELVVGVVPGLSGFLETSAPSDFIGKFRDEFSTDVNNAIAGVDLAEERRQRNKNAANETTIVVPEPKVTATMEAKLTVDGEELARASGAAAVRNGEKGIGPAMPAEQRGRVLRNGLQVTPLNPAEVLP